jgi:hypothetical protein
MTRASTDSPRWRAPYRVETSRLQLCALGPEHLAALQLLFDVLGAPIALPHAD